MLKHGDNFDVILENRHSPATAKVQLCIDIVLSIFRHNQMSMTVSHAVLEMAVHISRIPVCNHCKKILELTICKTEKAVEATRKIETTLPNAIESYFSLVGLDVGQRSIMELQ